MSLLYRAIWSEPHAGVPESAIAAFRKWVHAKTEGGLTVPDSGNAEAHVYTAPRPPGIPEQRFHAEVRVERASGGTEVPESLTAAFVETRVDGTRWDTTLRSWTEDGDGRPKGWLWVDVECVGPVELGRLAIAAPRLVVDLIATGQAPGRSGIDLFVDPQPVVGADQADNLASVILDPQRDVPLVVFSLDPYRNAQLRGFTFDQITRAAARQLAGVAVAYVADNAACWRLTELLGHDYAVWGGALRTYLPGVDLSTAGDNYRHKYVLADRYMGFKNLAGETVSRALGPASGTRRPAESYNAAKALIRSSRADDYEQISALLLADVDEATRQTESLRDDLNDAEERYMDLAIDLEEAVSERSELISKLDAAQRQIRAQGELMHRNGVEDTTWSADADVAPIPDRADNLSDAALKAQMHLADRLVLPDVALRDLENLDSTAESGSWGHTAWRGFRALHAYATDQAAGQNRGSFWDWCSSSMHALAWPATSKKLSMTESETVENNDTLRQARVLPISTDVSADGQLYMPAHLKISTGGGNLAPRIYFHFDPVKSTMHIGFFGPHKYMPNTRS